MEDYSINPEIAAKCDVEIQKHCNKGAMKEGKTIDCLMDLAVENEGKDDVIRPQCLKAVSTCIIRKENRGYVSFVLYKTISYLK